MKHVVKKSDVAHFWANKVQSDARNAGGNFYFDGDTIYSYGRHFPIAKHVRNEQGEPAVLFTERTYSNTTAKHISEVRWAADHLKRIYVFRPDASPEDNFNWWLQNAELIAQKLKKARKPEIYLHELAVIADTVNKYATFFSLPVPSILGKVLSITNKHEFSDYQEKKDAYEKAEKAKRERKQKADHKKALTKWLKGETDRLYSRNGQDYLRLHNGRIQTSQGIEMPIEGGRRLWQSIKDNTLKIGDQVLHYSVSEIGEITRIGCHTFPTKYLIGFGEKVFSK